MKTTSYIRPWTLHRRLLANVEPKCVKQRQNQGRRKQIDIGGGGGGGGAGNSGNLGGSGGTHPQIILKPRTPKYDFQRLGK